MESSTSSTFLPRNSRSMALSLLPHRLLALVLARHDEGAADVAVLDEAFAVLDAEQLRELQRARAAGVRNRDHDVDVVVRPLAQDLLGQLVAHAHAGLVHGDVVDDRVGPREIDVLEDAGRVPRRSARTAAMCMRPCSSMNTASPGPTSRTSLKPSAVERHALRSQHPLDGLARRRALPSTSGRMPFGSRKPRMPWPMIMATTA